MTTADKHKLISDRLLKENICAVPLDERSIALIDEYMMARQTGSELMRRLSTVELNFAQIASDASEASLRASNAKDSIAFELRKTVDDWRNKGILREFMFSFGESESEYIRNTFSIVTEAVRFQLNTISESLIILGETSAQIRACSTCFTEIYRESKLAIYAAALNRSKEDLLDCRAISLVAHASASESERASGIYLGRARICTKIIAQLNSMIIEVMYSLKMSSEQSERTSIISPVKAANSISDIILNLENIKLKIDE